MISDTANSAYLFASVLTAFNVVLQIALFVIVEAGSYDVSTLHAGWPTFVLLISIVTVFVVAQFFLWLSMLWFLFTHDAPFRPTSVLWLLLMLFTLSLGAAAYYVARYRKCCRMLKAKFDPEPAQVA